MGKDGESKKHDPLTEVTHQRLKRAKSATSHVPEARQDQQGTRKPPTLVWLLISVSVALAAVVSGAWPAWTAPRPLTESSPAQKQYGEASGIFPAGCKWRDVQYKGAQKDFWDVEQYEYWDEAKQGWTDKQPESCLVRGLQSKHRWEEQMSASPRTEVNCSMTHCIYEKLWYNNGRFILLVDGPTPVKSWKMTRNQDLNVLHVDNATAFVNGLQWRIIPNDTLLFDFVYFLHPTAIGHWSEMMFPLFSILRREAHFQWPPEQFVLLHLKRVHLMGWVRAVIATTLGVQPLNDLPPLIMQQETSSIWDQILSPLEGYGPREWVCFERALVVRDMFTGGERTFLSQEDAQAFRARIYAQYGLPPPASRPVPRTITFQRKQANRRVINEDQLISLLRTYGKVNVVEFNASTPFEVQLRTMADTGVFISVHTSNLANAQFLQPGSAVIEIIQRNWIWHNLDRSFQVQTEKMGDIHHFAWRARFRNQTVYINERDRERFGDWEPLQCSTEDCVEAHTNIDVVVNLDDFKALLDSRLPLVFANTSVADATLPWPPV